MNRLQPLAEEDSQEQDYDSSRRPLVRRIAGIFIGLVIAILALLGLWKAGQLLIQVSLPTWGALLERRSSNQAA